MKKWLCACVILGVAGVAQASGHGSSSGGLHVNWWSWDNHAPPVGWFILDFLLFLWLLKRFAGPKLQAFFAARRSTIEKEVTEAALFHAKASEARKEALRKRGAVDVEVKSLLASGVVDAEREADHILEEASSLGERMLRDAERVARQEEQRAKDRLKAVCARDALAEAERMLHAHIQESDRQRLLEESIVLLEKQAAGGAL
jgi:F0F1-type ATP synthase membrane subunit b/b'